MAGYGRLGSQWVKLTIFRLNLLIVECKKFQKMISVAGTLVTFASLILGGSVRTLLLLST